jgi:flagellar basal body-associated protein FliL
MKNPKVLLPVILLLFGGVYKFVLHKPPPPPKPKIAGEIYLLQKDFLVNLKGSHFAKLNAALELKEGYLPAAAGGAEAAAPPTGYGVMPQEPVIRSIITDTLTDQPTSHLLSDKYRLKLQAAIVKAIAQQTDVKVTNVVFTDVSVQ